MPPRARIVAAVCLVVAAALGGTALWLTPQHRHGGGMAGIVTAADVGGPFELVDHTGRTVTDADFRGRWMLVYFGFTNCPDMCPLDLATIAGTLDELGDAGREVTPLLITIDPARDTVAVLADYVALFHERLVGLTGTPEQIARAASAYRVYHRRAGDGADPGYLVDHSAFVHLMDRDGAFVTAFAHGTPPADMAAALRRHLAGGA